MDTDSPPHEPSRRSGALLFLYTLFGYSSSQSPAASEPVVSLSEMNAYQLGEFTARIGLPLLLLALGTYFAFRDRRPVARVFATLLVSLFVGGAALGFLEYSEDSAKLDLAQVEIRDLNSEIAALSEDGLDAGEEEFIAERTREVVEDLQNSENPQIATLGVVFETIQEIGLEEIERFGAAAGLVDSERFLNAELFASGTNTAWQRTTAQSYKKASIEMVKLQRRMPAMAERALRNKGVQEALVSEAVAGMRQGIVARERLFRAHGRMADIYTDMIELLESESGKLSIDSEGALELSTPRSRRAYNELLTQWDVSAEKLFVALSSLSVPAPNS